MKSFSIIKTSLIQGLIFTLVPITLEARMNISPPLQEIEISRGGIESFIIVVSNTDDEDVPSRFDVYNMDISERGIPIQADSSYTRGCANWIKLEKAEYIIKAHEYIEVKCTVRAPTDAEGSYYAMIKGSFTTSAPPIYFDEKIEESMINIETKASVVIMVTISSSRNRAILVPDMLIIEPQSSIYGTGSMNSRFSFSPNVGWGVILDLRNDGNIHTQAQAMASIWSEAGSKIGSSVLDAGRGYVLPCKIRRFTGKGETPLSDGNYMIRINIRSKDGKTMANSLPFTIYNGKFYQGSPSDRIAELVRASSPGYTLVEPFKEIKVTPGGRSYGAFKVINFISDTLNLVAKKVEWTVDNEGYLQVSNDQSIQPRSSSHWIHFINDTLKIPPNRSREFKYTVTPPDTINGEYYSAVVFDRDSIRYNLPAEFYTQRSQLFVMNPRKGLSYSLEIDSIKIKKISIEEASVHRFQFELRNTGSGHCYTKGNFSLSREVAHERFKPIGKPEGFGGSNIYMMPGTSREMYINVPNLEPGLYEALVTVSFKDGHQSVNRFQRFTID